MDSLRHAALGCCVLCAFAGVLRVFWPENSMKSVINMVLTLYIIASAVQLAAGYDWAGLSAELRGWTRQQAEIRDYTDFGLVQTVQTGLKQAGISATVTMKNGICHVLVTYPRDAEAARTLLPELCGEVPFEVKTGGDVP